MRPRKLKLTTILFSALGLNGLLAQEAIPASGDIALGSEGSVSYTVGQIVYTTIAGTFGSVAQGVQQPYEISVVSALNEAKEISLQCSAYPNPATDILTLKIEGDIQPQCNVSLFAIDGKLLENKKIHRRETKIILTHLIPEMYILKVNQGKRLIKSFRIIKN